MSVFDRQSNPVNRVFSIFITALLFISLTTPVLAESSVPQTDQTPSAPLGSPNAPAQPRYMSGFGQDNTYTIFYEDRHEPCTAETWRIYFNQTTSGPLGLASTSTATNVCETHFTVKDWPITIGGTTYAYRGWGAQGNNPSHAFYVSNDMVTWTQHYLGTGMFADPLNVMSGETINYGFHDIIQLNGNYIGFAESAGGNTYIVWSDNGDETWRVIAKVGGSENADGPLALSFTPAGPIPTGNFILMEVGGEMVYGKLMVPGNRNGAYLAINRAAAQAATPALAETAFMNPVNWTWRDGTAGAAPGPANAVLTTTAARSISEVWSVPTSDYRANHVILYDASYGGTRGIGCAATDPQCLVQLPPAPPAPVSTGTLVCPQNGGTVTQYNWTVVVPPGALPECAYVTINPVNSVAGLGNPANQISTGHLVSIQASTQSGTSLTSFAPALQICFTYSSSELAKASYDPSNFTIWTARQNATTWNGQITNIAPAQRQACARVNHLSYFDLFLPVFIIPTTGFAPDRATILPEQSVDYSAMGDLWLEIPKISAEMNIVGVPFQSNTWDVTWLGEDAGWLEGTAYPTRVGNTTITGHVWDASNHPGPFSNLKQLKWGDDVIVHSGGAEYVYEVRSVQTVNPGNTSLITKHEEYSWITLITCQNYNPATDEYDQRLVVRAVLVEVRE